MKQVAPQIISQSHLSLCPVTLCVLTVPHHSLHYSHSSINSIIVGVCSHTGAGVCLWTQLFLSDVTVLQPGKERRARMDSTCRRCLGHCLVVNLTQHVPNAITRSFYNDFNYFLVLFQTGFMNRARGNNPSKERFPSSSLHSHAAVNV